MESFRPSPERFESMARHRRHLHRQPEVGLELPDTHAYLESALTGLGLRVEVHPASGLTARIKGSNPETCPIIFRADMDALPVDEDVDSDFRSTRQGAMHACGHDLHMATLLGVVEDLLATAPTRDVIVAFQPGEESDRGALATLQHKNLDLEKAEVFAIHVNAVMPTGAIGYTPGTFMAYGDWFRLHFGGQGGHASAPERTGSPIRAGASFVEGLVNLALSLSRDDARVVATTTEFLSGNTVNVIPTEGSLRGTLRTVSADQRAALHRGIRELVDQSAARHRVQGDLEIIEGYPAVICDEGFIEKFLRIVREIGLADSLQLMEHPSMVIEDFSYFLHKWPGAMVYVGAAVGENPTFNHSATAQFDEAAMATSFALFTALARQPGAGGN